MAISSSTSSTSSTSGASSGTKSTSGSTTSGKSESTGSKPEPSAAFKPKDSIKLSEEADHSEAGVSFDYLSGLGSTFGDSDSLPGAFCVAPEGFQVSGHATGKAGLDTGPISGDGKGTVDVTSSSNKGLVTPDGNFVDTELRNTVTVGTEATLNLRASSSDSRTVGLGTSMQATLPHGPWGGCVDPSSPSSWAPGTDFSVMRDQFQQSDQVKTLGPWAAGSVSEHRQGEIQGVSKEGSNVVAYEGQVTTDLSKYQAGLEFEKSGSLDWMKDSKLAGHFGMNLSIGRNDSVERVKGNFSELTPDGSVQTGTLERTTYENGVALNAQVSAGAHAEIKGWTLGGEVELGGMAMGNGTYRSETVKDYDNSLASEKTSVYAETSGGNALRKRSREPMVKECPAVRRRSPWPPTRRMSKTGRMFLGPMPVFRAET